MTDSPGNGYQKNSGYKSTGPSTNSLESWRSTARNNYQAGAPKQENVGESRNDTFDAGTQPGRTTDSYKNPTYSADPDGDLNPQDDWTTGKDNVQATRAGMDQARNFNRPDGTHTNTGSSTLSDMD